MKKKLSILAGLLSFVFLWVIPPIHSSWAGQVITEDARLWAKKVLKEEKTLQAVKGQNTLAVLYFQNKTGHMELTPLQKGLALMLITDLSNVKGLQLIERANLQALTEEMGLGASGLVEAGTAPRIGKLLGAQWMVGGDITEGQAALLQIQSNILKVQTQSILGHPVVKGALSDLFSMEKDLLLSIIKLLKIKLTPEEEGVLKKPMTTNINALMALFSGIEESDNGNYMKASEFYKKALKEDPNIGVAKESLKELKDLGLINVTSKSRELLRSVRDQTSLTDQLSPEDTARRERTPMQVISPINMDITFPAP